ncbi:MAG: bifunctional 3-deoxy-7-phosphoheptulonate synthase/chorismate mutase type II [Victivallales bacterium]|jgi:chorismate mutase|nr:bifunctional 3-deoxy-7-phosphoheptulonate synthase/chorismate mutase type II [Victivallales bacterium]MBT7166849.1 bifunctional 3-deoxy-7-phosphoheptulonate synthase/chorismate mutase type II [Victivallales bacterium]MBT7300283.1 bifunctional 3-deoxy-7-phosphoheptulonate synthase/chorismate mutase type II [Victivallales bacterium]
MNTLPLSQWDLPNPQRPIVIAGPCSAESEEQMLATARGLAGSHVSVFRAGIWKPRTRPGSFEGYGSIALDWLRTVKQETGLWTATEVASPKHVYEALRTQVDLVWIGARTSANPFAVQEIADALRGVNIPVLVKNPVNPDVDLWQGAIERLADSGLGRIGAIHRGFSSASKSPYRNEPQWQLPIELRRRLPDVPMFCDPSHIAGNTEFIEDLVRRAMSLAYDGVMVETHCNPGVALSDAQQQLTPEQLHNLLTHVVVPQMTSESPDFQSQLSELRAEIDECDRQLLELLSRRMEVAVRIGQIKKDNNIAVLQTGRWDAIVQRIHERASQYGFSTDFVDKVFTAIHQESIDKQQHLILEED